MKFETQVHKIEKNYQQTFHKDPCTHVSTRGKNVRARVSSRQKRARARLRIVCARLWTDLYEKFVGSSLLSYELKFQIS